jgi:threonine dehydratase
MSIELDDIEAAAARIEGHALRTPLLESPAASERLGFRLLIKPECLQRMGAFKIRGAYHRMVRMPEEERARGVVACSSGNHAQGVALAAKLLGAPATLVMPSDAPKVKVEATRGLGAEIRFYDRMTGDREAITREVAAERGAALVPPYDHPDVIAGQGTVGLELGRDVHALGARLDLLLCPVGGGGLLAGTSTAIKALSPSTRVVGVEPSLFDDTARSLARGERVTLSPTKRSLCDALESPSPGVLTFPILQKNVAEVVTVTDAEVTEAMRFAFSVLKLVVEPGGAAALAALLAGKVDAKGKTVGVVLSGSNVDPELFARVLRREI